MKYLDPNQPIANGQIVDWDRTRYDADTTRERSTRLKAMLDPRGPRAYYLALNPPEREMQKHDEYQKKISHFEMGILFHEWILDGQINWVACPHSRGTKGWVRAVLRNPGKLILSEGQDKELRAWREALMGNPLARQVFETVGFREQVIIWDELVECFDESGTTVERYVPCKAALDSMDSRGNIICIKTTRATDREEWEREVRRLHYDFSAGFYDRGRRSIPNLAGTSATFTHLVVMKAGQHTPPACYSFELGELYMELGCKRVVNSLKKLAECLDKQEQIEADGGNVLDAWPDDIAAKQSEPVVPEPWQFDKYELEASQR